MAQLFRAVVATLIEIEIGAVVSLAFRLSTEVTIVTAVLVIVLSVIYCRNHLFYLFLSFIIFYAASARYSRHKISNFFDSIVSDTKPTQLSELAKKAAVDFHSSPNLDKVGEFYGGARDPFTTGDFACRIEFDSTHIISSKASTH